jgi:hypothetical protein
MAYMQSLFEQKYPQDNFVVKTKNNTQNKIGGEKQTNYHT